MKSLVHTEVLCSWSVPLEHARGAILLVCIGLYGNLRKVPPFLMKSRIFLGFVFDIKRINFLE